MQARVSRETYRAGVTKLYSDLDENGTVEDARKRGAHFRKMTYDSIPVSAKKVDAKYSFPEGILVTNAATDTNR